MFDEYNQLTKSFRWVRDVYDLQQTKELKLKLIFKRQTNGQVCNLPIVEEIAGLVAGDVDSANHRDIILHAIDGQL